jgi:hypothetical protein
VEIPHAFCFLKKDCGSQKLGHLWSITFCHTSPSQDFHYKIRGRTGEYGHMCFGQIYQYEKISQQRCSPAAHAVGSYDLGKTRTKPVMFAFSLDDVCSCTSLWMNKMNTSAIFQFNFKTVLRWERCTCGRYLFCWRVIWVFCTAQHRTSEGINNKFKIEFLEYWFLPLELERDFSYIKRWHCKITQVKRNNNCTVADPSYIS